MEDLYARLGARPDASDAELRRAYRTAVRCAHPDAGGSRMAFEAVRHAWWVLGDPVRRAAYDRSRAVPVPADTTPSGPLVRPNRLTLLGPVALSGAFASTVVGAVSFVLLCAVAAYTLLTLLAVGTRVRSDSDGAQWCYRLARDGAWVLTATAAVLSVTTWVLGGSPTAALLATACLATFATATTVVGLRHEAPPEPT